MKFKIFNCVGHCVLVPYMT